MVEKYYQPIKPRKKLIYGTSLRQWYSCVNLNLRVKIIETRRQLGLTDEAGWSNLTNWMGLRSRDGYNQNKTKQNKMVEKQLRKIFCVDI